MGGLIIYAHSLADAAEIKVNYSLTIEPTTVPIKHELALMSFLESTTNVGGREVPMKKLIAASVVQNSENIYFNGESVPLDSISQNILNTWSTDKGFLLQIKKPDKNIKLVWNLVQFRGTESVLRIQKISTRIISPFESGILELIVR